MRLSQANTVVQVAVALAVALVAAPVVRSVTVELNTTVGRVWPFSMARCHAPTTPGCSVQPALDANGPYSPLAAVGRR